jgi:hypothetical protein
MDKSTWMWIYGQYKNDILELILNKARFGIHVWLESKNKRPAPLILIIQTYRKLQLGLQ